MPINGKFSKMFVTPRHGLPGSCGRSPIRNSDARCATQLRWRMKNSNSPTACERIGWFKSATTCGRKGLTSARSFFRLRTLSVFCFSFSAFALRFSPICMTPEQLARQQIDAQACRRRGGACRITRRSTLPPDAASHCAKSRSSPGVVTICCWSTVVLSV